MGSIRWSWRGRGNASNSEIGGGVAVEDDAELDSIVLGGCGMYRRKEPGGSPFLVGSAFLILPSGSHWMDASSVSRPCRLLFVSLAVLLPLLMASLMTEPARTTSPFLRPRILAM